MSQVGAPGRYQRSFGGMVGALIVAVAVILAYVVFRAMTREDLDVQPDHVDYRAVVAEMQGAGVDVVYPDALPQGWYARGVDRGDPNGEDAVNGIEWGISLLTADDDYVGVRQLLVSDPARADAGLETMISRLVDENATEGDSVNIDSAVGTQWRSWTDQTGDIAYATEMDGDWVLVYGSASPQQLTGIAQRLTTDPVTG